MQRVRIKSGMYAGKVGFLVEVGVKYDTVIFDNEIECSLIDKGSYVKIDGEEDEYDDILMDIDSYLEEELPSDEISLEGLDEPEEEIFDLPRCGPTACTRAAAIMAANSEKKTYVRRDIDKESAKTRAVIFHDMKTTGMKINECDLVGLPDHYINKIDGLFATLDELIEFEIENGWDK